MKQLYSHLAVHPQSIVVPFVPSNKSLLELKLGNPSVCSEDKKPGKRVCPLLETCSFLGLVSGLHHNRDTDRQT